MLVLVKSKILQDVLDYYKSNKEYRIEVIGICNLENISSSVYFIRPYSFNYVWNYIKEIGIFEVIKKIISRFFEKYRNEKYFSIGFGKVLEVAENNKFKKGDIVGFIAFCHPKFIERIVLPEDFIFRLDKKLEEKIEKFINNDYSILIDNSKNKLDLIFEEIKGWSIYSGKLISKDKLEKCFIFCNNYLNNINWDNGLKIEKKQFYNSEIKEIYINNKYNFKNKQKRGILFGYGHYAKTIILPNIKKYIKVENIHEIDPLQSYFIQKDKIKILDTSPFHRSNEKYDVCIIAGFHHHHAPIAIEAIERGEIVVSEKPIVTEWDQLDLLLNTLKKFNGRYYVGGFHRRFSPFNKFIFKDLKLSLGDPINYHCIVYEVPEPPFHWYRWPNSHSEIITNGCHWIDHFLFLNNWSEIKNFNAEISSDKRIFSVYLELQNNAFFTMTLTTKGADYIGFQDYVELRSFDTTIKIINYSHYISENSNGVIRSVKINKLDNYNLMYKKIGEMVFNDEHPGDSLQSIKISSEAILLLEDIIIKKTKK